MRLFPKEGASFINPILYDEHLSKSVSCDTVLSGVLIDCNFYHNFRITSVLAMPAMR